MDEITHRWTDGNDFVEHRINALREAAPLIATMTPAQQIRQAGRLADRLDLDYLTVIDAILEHAPIDHEAIAPDPADPLRLPKRPTLLTDLQPNRPAPNPTRLPNRTLLGRGWPTGGGRNRPDRPGMPVSQHFSTMPGPTDQNSPTGSEQPRRSTTSPNGSNNSSRRASTCARSWPTCLLLTWTWSTTPPSTQRISCGTTPKPPPVQDVSEADLSRVAGLIAQTWPDTADLAQQVVEDPRFPATVRAIMAAENQGLDAADLLARVPRETVAAVGEKASFVAHALRVAATEIAEPDRGWDPHPADDPTWHLDGAADVLQNAWREHAQAVEKVVASPGFDMLAARMAEAQQAGLDAGALLETIDPDKIAAARVPSPAGITAAALDRAAAEAKIPAWTEREYGHFTDETLAAELAHARAQLDAAVTDRAALAEEARALDRGGRRRPRTGRPAGRPRTRRTPRHRARTRSARRSRI